MIVLLSFMDLAGVAEFLREQAGRITLTRKIFRQSACDPRKCEEVLETVTREMYPALHRFLRLLRRHVRSNPPPLQHEAAFLAIEADAKTLFGILENEKVSHFQKMRQITDEFVEGFSAKLNEFLELVGAVS